MRQVLLAAGIAVLLTGQSFASGSVVCSGVTPTSSYDIFTKLGWQAFWGVKGKRAELWLENHTKVTVHVLLRTQGGYVDNTLVSPNGTKTMYFPNDDEVGSVECSYWSGQQAFQPINPAPTGSGLQLTNDPDDLVLNDPDDLGGVSVDVDPEAEVTNLDSLRGKILKAL